MFIIIGEIVLIFCCLNIVLAHNMVDAIIFLIIFFCSTAFFLIESGFDFFGLLFIIIYVGAIAVLFLFVLMLLPIKSVQEERKSKEELFFWGILVFFFICSNFFRGIPLKSSGSLNYLEYIDRFTNIEVFGLYFYNFFNFLFLLTGIILLIALIGAVVLTATTNDMLFYRKQIEYKQISRNS